MVRKSIGEILAATITGLVLTTPCVSLAATGTEPVDWTFPVQNVIDGKKVDATWTPIPLSEINKTWNICVLLPHLKDAYWIAVDYGLYLEAKRDHATFHVYTAGGYTDLPTQLNQMENCISQKFDAIILGAISPDGVGALVKKAIAANIPVIDVVNGINEPSVSAHALVDFSDMGYTAAKYIANSTKGQDVKLGYFPGAEGAGYEIAASAGFAKAIGAGTPNIHTLATRYGDTGANVQLDLVQNALQAYPDMNYILGCTVCAQSAAVAVRNAGLQGKVKVVSFAPTPVVLEDVKNGSIEATSSDSTVMQGRMSVDMAIKLLEHKALPSNRSGPKIQLVTHDNIDATDLDSIIAPKSFKPVFSSDDK